MPTLSQIFAYLSHILLCVSPYLLPPSRTNGHPCQRLRKGGTQFFPWVIQILLGEAIGLALLSLPPVPHEVIPLQVMTRGLKHTKQVPSDLLEEVYPSTGQGGEGGARGIRQQ